MLPLAHIGAALLVGKAARGNTGFAVLGALAPDLVDKPPAWVMKVTPSGRFLGHSLLFWFLLSLATTRLFGSRAGLGFGLGYLVHLAGDTEATVPWLMPLVAYDLPKDHHFRLVLSRQQLAREAIGLGVILFFAWRSREGSSRKANRGD